MSGVVEGCYGRKGGEKNSVFVCGVYLDFKLINDIKHLLNWKCA